MAEQYPNRTDLRNPAGKVAKQAATGQPYGEAGKQMAAQSVVPMAAPPTESAASSQPAPPMPGSLGALNRDSEFPDRPGTYGVDAGPGPGYTEAGLPLFAQSADPVLQELLILYKQFPNDGLANLISAIQYGGM